jgi:two-component system cell cycle sensor histidine kinase/response regulator CckA
MEKLRILIVEDEAILALNVQRLLNRLGYDAFGIATSGEDAIEIARRERPDLIMMDIHLRGKLDGIQVAERIRAFLDAPVIYTSAFSDDETLERAKKTEPSAFLLKPYEIKDLQVAIEMCHYRYNAERKIRDNERRISTILKSIGDSVVTADNSGAVTFMNPNAERLTGWRLEEAAGRPVLAVLELLSENPDGTTSPPPGSADGPDASGESHGVFVLLNRQGESIPVECGVTSLKEDRGGTIGRVFVLRDISAIRREEEEMRRIEAELAQSQKMEAVGKFAGGIAHDFNNYLAVIGGLTELQLKSDEGTGVPVENLQMALEAVEKANGLTRNLLQFSRKKPIQMVEVDVNRTIENLMVLVKCILSARIKITTNLHPDGPRIKADPVQLEQILMNLVINARDAMPSGGRLTIRTERTLQDAGDSEPRSGRSSGRFIRITVSDSGTGMTANRLRDDGAMPSVTSKPNGTGFGLFIIHDILKRHGGFVQFESAPGKGTAFHVFFPELETAGIMAEGETAAVKWIDHARESCKVSIN